MNDIFDDIVREKLRDVSIKPPKRVWRGVSAQLHRRSVFYSLGAIAGVCCAFAMLFAIVLRPTSSVAPTISAINVVVEDVTYQPLALESGTFSSEVIA